MFSMAGRLILTKYTLASIPSHVMLFIKIPDITTKTINEIQRNFFWGSTADKKKIHLLSRERISIAKEKGGLGLKNVRSEIRLVMLGWLGEFTRTLNLFVQKSSTANTAYNTKKD